MNNDLPKVSLVAITYGHEKYIKETLDGVMMQQYAGSVEFIIANDNSPDATDEVVKKYFLENPAPSNFEIKYTKHETNKGMMPNFFWALEQVTGKYIALCEGDDYWTDPYKLQKQVDFLEANEDYVIHSGNAQILSNDSSNASIIIENTSDSVFEIDHFYKNNNIITCTVLFRNQTIDFPDFYNKITFGDWFLYVILMSKTKQKAYRTSELFSVYRIHSGGVMSNLSKEKNLLAHVFQIKSIQKYIGNRYYSKDIERKLNYYYLEIFLLRCYDENYKNALLILFENLKSCFKTFPIKSYFGFLKLFILKKINHLKK